ncbi:hypothetical protein F511_32039 [Dorcoceras hygrometricum]|uniref:Uncharacterized protein n=1 Tax=Dorcoceras hygrometricum TaxID=472368 RepID=A0A2Z7CMC7_9LAMI|nr:hypothetical protein F511_32039 [Dorcoceras hygrometricum]
MPPKRREKTDKNKDVDNMPGLEELPADEEHQEMSVQNMVDRIEGQSHGPATAKKTVEPQGEVPEKNAVDMEEASKMQFAKLHKTIFGTPGGTPICRLKREQSDKNKEVDIMPELEELPADEEHRVMSVQNMVDRIEGHSHGHAIAKQPAESHEEILEKNTVEMEEASKMMAEGILAYVKAVVSHITQSTTQGSFQHKGVEQGARSSRACETRRSIPTSQSLDERYTPPHQKDEAVFREAL